MFWTGERPGMTVYEADIPGVGRKFEVDIGGDARVVVIIHHDGRREMFRRDNPDADSEKLADLTAAQARTVGSILTGAYFESVPTEDLTVPLGEAIIEWVDVTEDSPLVGQTLGEAHIRRETGASVLAIQRGPDTLANPDPDTTIETDDILVTLGTREEQAELDALLAGDS